jgi:predicted RNA-binding Zn-ribbon protein involved in translation (DUF1610 family)
MSLVHAEGVHKPAFRCKACGHLVPAAHAGELAVPLACPVCGGGVAWNKGMRTVVPDSWEVLADMEPEELEKHGLKPEDVERHAPFTTRWVEGEPQHTVLGDPKAPTGGARHERTAGDGSLKVSDKSE